MSHRQTKPMERDDRELPGRDVSLLIDEHEGRVPRREARGGRASRGQRRGSG